jgi:hypothetical protein
LRGQINLKTILIDQVHLHGVRPGPTQLPWNEVCSLGGENGFGSCHQGIRLLGKNEDSIKIKIYLIWNFDFSVNNSLSKHKKMNHLIIKSKKAVTA